MILVRTILPRIRPCWTAGRRVVKSGYDCKQLMRWIANSEAYNLTSRGTKKNERDNPAAGEAALFSHVYVKSMTAEQLYDSSSLRRTLISQDVPAGSNRKNNVRNGYSSSSGLSERMMAKNRTRSTALSRRP